MTFNNATVRIRRRNWARRSCVPLVATMMLCVTNGGGKFLQSCSGFTATTTTARTAAAIRGNAFMTKLRAYNNNINNNRGGEKLPIMDAQVVHTKKLTTTATDPIAVVKSPSLTPATKRQSTDPTPVLFSMFQSFSKPTVALMATAALTVALLISPLPSWAASSGGRMGGSFSSPSRGGGGGGRLSAPSSFGRGGGGGYSQGYGSGYYSRPSVAITPFYSPFYSPFPQPYLYGGSPGVAAYSRGPSIFDFLLIGGVLFAVANFVRNAEIGSNDLGWTSTASSALGSGTGVVQLSVALEVSNREDPNSILAVLSRLAATARTDSRVGIQNLTGQVALELLRRKSSIVSAASQYQHYNDRNKAQREFQSLAVKERGKFEQETVSKYGGVDYSNTDRRSSSTVASGVATMAVVTLVLAIDGDSTRVGSIRSMADVEEALRKIAANAKVDDCLQSCEILWTPEERSETLTLRDVVADYPELRSI